MCLLELALRLIGTLEQLLPAQLHVHEEVFDVRRVLLAAKVLEVGSLMIDVLHIHAMRVDIASKHLQQIKY